MGTRIVGLGCVFVAVALIGCQSYSGTASSSSNPSPQARGKYLIRIGGCNDCHTPGFSEQGEKVPEELWLTGVPMGFRGPWGTTYATNLRRFTSTFTEDLFVAVMRSRNARPPMPWQILHAMSEPDLRAMYQYIHSLPVTGENSPEFVPAGTEPKTPYILFEPVMPKAG